MASDHTINEKHNVDDSRIKIIDNGPYIISGSIPLLELIIGVDEDGEAYQWLKGVEYPSQERYSLCRCGASKKKPYCDGEHVKNNFNGIETASRRPYQESAKIFDGPVLRLGDFEELCASGRFCLRGEGVWVATEHSDDPMSRNLAINETAACPAGRLVIWDKFSGKPIEPELEWSIGLVEDPQEGVSGPIWVRGGIPVVGADGKVYEIRNRVTLCRCGRSGNKPFCDSSHLND